MKYVAITVTNYGKGLTNDASKYEVTETSRTFTTMSYEEGMCELRKLEKLLGRAAQLEVNQFNPVICHKTLHGYIRE